MITVESIYLHDFLCELKSLIQLLKGDTANYAIEKMTYFYLFFY